ASPRFSHGVSAERYASFQARAMRRRLDRCVDSARDAIRRGKLKDAAAALDEVKELDPECAELPALTTQFDALRRRVATSHRGPWLAAAATFAGTMLGATYLQDASSLASRQIVAAGVLMPDLTPSAAALVDALVVGTTGERAPIDLSQPLTGVEA